MLPENTSHSNVPLLLLLLLLRILRPNSTKVHHSLWRLQHKSCENAELAVLTVDNKIGKAYHPLSWHRHPWRLGSSHWLVGNHKHLLDKISQISGGTQKRATSHHLARPCSYNWCPACNWRRWTGGWWCRRWGSLIIQNMWKCSINCYKDQNLLALVATLLTTADNPHLKIGSQRPIEGLVLLNIVRGFPHRLQHWRDRFHQQGPDILGCYLLNT